MQLKKQLIPFMVNCSSFTLYFFWDYFENYEYTKKGVGFPHLHKHHGYFEKPY